MSQYYTMNSVNPNARGRLLSVLQKIWRSLFTKAGVDQCVAAILVDQKHVHGNGYGPAVVRLQIRASLLTGGWSKNTVTGETHPCIGQKRQTDITKTVLNHDNDSIMVVGRRGLLLCPEPTSGL